MMTMRNSTFLKQREEVMDIGCARVLLCGKAFVADAVGALYWPAECTLIVSDLHLEKGSYLSEDSVQLPPFDTRSAFEKLEEAIDRWSPERVVALGDSFCGGPPLSIYDMDWLRDLMEGREWIWAAGDDGRQIPEGVGGSICSQYSLGGLRFRHEPTPALVGHEIAGGRHPVARVVEYGHVIRTRCYVSNGLRLVMPSMGVYSSGLNVLDEAFTPLLGREGLFVWVLTNGKAYPVAAGQLVEEAAA